MKQNSVLPFLLVKILAEPGYCCEKENEFLFLRELLFVYFLFQTLDPVWWRNNFCLGFINYLNADCFISLLTLYIGSISQFWVGKKNLLWQIWVSLQWERNTAHSEKKEMSLKATQSSCWPFKNHKFLYKSNTS